MQPVNTAFHHQTINFLNAMFEDIHDRKDTHISSSDWLLGRLVGG